MSEQFSRSIALLQQEGFSRLQKARVAVFGVGGVGGYVCEALVRSGLTQLDIFDRDDVSESNLNRQIIALRSTLGRDKCDAMADRLRDINPEAVIRCHRMFYLPENADEVDLTQYDYVVDAVDTVAAKIELAIRCQQLGVPLIAAMGAGNKLDPSRLQLADISKTSVCPLARAMRTALRRRGVKKLTVAFSTEEPVRPAAPIAGDSPVRKDVPGSMVFVPAAMGLLIASHVVRQLTLPPVQDEAE
ncbi:MAG: tRNA threonylcarbamoyladenosine dehydratase [Clostridia bacterium]|nr:tRNA threonylcarbamoyladenosine dehydratase [Clostridia bacterium]